MVEQPEPARVLIALLVLVRLHLADKATRGTDWSLAILCLIPFGRTLRPQLAVIAMPLLLVALSPFLVSAASDPHALAMGRELVF